MLALLVWIWNPEKKAMPAWMIAAGLAFYSASAVAVPRDLASMAFPSYRATSDTDDILEDYPSYLKFALTIGQDVNPSVARQIEERYARLRRADEQLAARFLKGLRFEMIQKMELSGLSPRSTTTDNPTMRRWVQRYLPAWLREVDEYQFRAFATAIVKK